MNLFPKGLIFPMNPHGVIFDMDGVLIDSYDAHFESWCLTAKKYGLSISAEQFSRTFGRTSRETIAIFWADQNFSLGEILDMDAEKEHFFRELLSENLPLMPGVSPFLLNFALRALVWRSDPRGLARMSTWSSKNFAPTSNLMRS